MKTEGFTLIELMTGLVLAGLAAYFFSLLYSGLNIQVLKREAYRLAAVTEDLTLLSRQKEADLILRLTPLQYEARDMNGLLSDHGPYLLPKGVSIYLGDSDKKDLRFYKSGVSTPASVYLRYKSNSCTVVLSLRGRVSYSCY